MVSSLVPVFERLALRHGTNKTYASLLRHYERFCRDTGRDPCQPISETRLCEAAIYFCSQRSVQGLATYVSALQWWHTVSGFGPLHRGGLYSRVRKGLGNVYGQFDKAEPAFALSLHQVYEFFPHLSLRAFDDARNWCALLFGFFGLLRVGEYTSASSAKVHLRVKHVAATAEGICLVVPFSKTSLTPTAVRICARGDILCPVAAYRHYLSFFRRPRSPDEPFFTTSPHLDPSSPSLSSVRSLTPDVFTKWLKHQAVRIGLEPKHISGHSLRRGGTTALFIAGCSEAVIARHGRWKSDCYKIYFDAAVPHYLATQTLLRHSNGRFLSSSSSSLHSQSSAAFKLAASSTSPSPALLPPPGSPMPAVVR